MHTSAIKHGVKKVICLSTDKAAYPINAMGISKASWRKLQSQTQEIQGTQLFVFCVCVLVFFGIFKTVWSIAFLTHCIVVELLGS